jgi:tRNA-splicing ligase RtcB
MSFEVVHGARVPIKAWIRGVPVAAAAKQQLLNLAGMPFVFSHVAAMPDMHWGVGATVGSVIATQGAIIPAAVGVDIGCGMAAQRTTLTASDLPDNLHALRSAIEARIPHGRTNNGGLGDRGAWGEAPYGHLKALRHELDALKTITDKHPKIAQAAERAPLHAGTLGTGNHFIEVCLDETQCVWLLLHSGSRGIGNRIGSYFIEAAKKDMQRWFITLPDKDLAYLPQGSSLFDDYIEAVGWAQGYARTNRDLMRGVPQGCGRAGRDARRLQGHRRRDGRASRSGGRGAHAEADGLREGLNSADGGSAAVRHRAGEEWPARGSS